jgi:hypothetical protein
LSRRGAKVGHGRRAIIVHSAARLHDRQADETDDTQHYGKSTIQDDTSSSV